MIKDCPPDFLNEEVRCGYTVTAKMKRVWKVEIDLLQVFAELCEKHHLRYWVAYGTLLGAVRHQGFIPWDNDVDVWMPREDYEKLLQIEQAEIPEPYFLQTTLNDNDYYCPYARLRNSNTTEIGVTRNNRCNNGIYLDVFPLDGFPCEKLTQKFRWHLIHLINIYTHAYIYNHNPSRLTRFLNTLTHLPGFRPNLARNFRRINALARKVPFSAADWVSCVVFPASPYPISNYRRADFDDTVMLPFEYIQVAAPAGYDGFLKTRYGNYMQFPPVSKRGTWNDMTFEPDIPYKQYMSGQDQTPAERP